MSVLRLGSLIAFLISSYDSAIVCYLIVLICQPPRAIWQREDALGVAHIKFLRGFAILDGESHIGCLRHFRGRSAG